MTTARPLRLPAEPADDYDVRLARLREEMDVLEEEIAASNARLALLRRQTEVLERASRGPVRIVPSYPASR